MKRESQEFARQFQKDFEAITLLSLKKKMTHEELEQVQHLGDIALSLPVPFPKWIPLAYLMKNITEH